MGTKAKRGEQRRFGRVALPCRLRYLRIPKQPEGYRDATVLDVSHGGIRIRAGERFTSRSCFLFDLCLPGSGPIRSLATVAWVRAMPGDDGFQVGGAFVEPSADVERALASLVPPR